ncbi:MAG: hypothetical protein AMXMBFR13_09780 [Phycisphaerae bacterium]
MQTVTGRTIRQWLTANIIEAALAAAPRMPEWAIAGLERLVATGGTHVPVLRSIVAANMRAAGVWSEQNHAAYFARAAAHLAGVLHVFRHASGIDQGTTGRIHPDLARYVESVVRLDDSFDCLRRAAAAGRGVVLMGVHASHFMLVVARMNQELPITVYLRHSRDPRRQQAKQQWCRAAGLEFIAEPPNAADPTRRAALMAEALHAGRVLIITPDLPQKRELGAPVDFLGREIYLPAGPAALSLLAESPIVTVLARPAEDPQAIILSLHGPLAPDAQRGYKGWRQEAIRQRLQWFVDLFTSEFLLKYPALWFLWGDKRWTRVFRGDPRYTGPVQRQPQGPREHAGPANAAKGVA